MRRLEPADARDRTNPLRTLVNTKERAVIVARARASGLTVSAYLRSAAIGAPLPRASTQDLSAVDALVKVNADQGRLGGLLKMYLQDPNPDRRTAERLLADIESIRVDLRAAVRRLGPS